LNEVRAPLQSPSQASFRKWTTKNVAWLGDIETLVSQCCCLWLSLEGKMHRAKEREGNKERGWIGEGEKGKRGEEMRSRNRRMEREERKERK